MAFFQHILEQLGLRTPDPQEGKPRTRSRDATIPPKSAKGAAAAAVTGQGTGTPGARRDKTPAPHQSHEKIIELPASRPPAHQLPDLSNTYLSDTEMVNLAHPVLPDSSHAETVLISTSARSLKTILQDIEKFASWHEVSSLVDLEKVLRECRAAYPQAEKDIEKHLQRGKDSGQLLKTFHELGQQYGADSGRAQEALAQIKSSRPDLVYEAKRRLESGDLIWRKRLEIEELQRAGGPISQVRHRPYHIIASRPPAPCPLPASAIALHPQDIRGLSPSLQWLLLIEETGIIFNESAIIPAHQEPEACRFVGLLLPVKDHGLAPFPMKAMEHSSLSGLDHVVQAILDAPVGVIGFIARPAPMSWMDHWSFGVLRLIEYVLRLMPINTPTQLRVQIGRLGAFKRQDEWQAVAQNALSRLAEVYPGRARRVTCQIEVVRKEESPFNGYVDALAFLWGSTDPHSRECLTRSELLGHCLMLGDVEGLFGAWERLDRGLDLESEAWAMLLAQPGTLQPASLAGTLLERVGQACQTNANLWQRYLDDTLDRLQNKTIDFRELGRQVEWLEACLPSGHTLPPALRLLSLTTRLTQNNRPLGPGEQTSLEELRALCDRLMDENAHLVCRVEMTLAAHATRHDAFDLAKRTLERWRSQPKAVLGLRYWAQVQSDLGQQAAFRGDMTTAVALFDQAITAFGQLSNPREGRREARQTRVHRAIALMDDPQRSEGVVRSAVAEGTGRSIAEAIAQCAVPDCTADPVPHYLLLRWLVHRPQPDIAATYLATRDQWFACEGSLWSLIQLYRGFLLCGRDLPAARALAMAGFHLALSDEQTPVTRLRGVCCRAVAMAWGEAPWPNQPAALAELEALLPHARDRVAYLQRFLRMPDDPLELLRTLLPFNLR
ncbi:DUF3987 domain-containing protein [Gammaproteobacteria bacterium]